MQFLSTSIIYWFTPLIIQKALFITHYIRTANSLPSSTLYRIFAYLFFKREANKGVILNVCGQFGGRTAIIETSPPIVRGPDGIQISTI